MSWNPVKEGGLENTFANISLKDLDTDFGLLIDPLEAEGVPRSKGKVRKAYSGRSSKFLSQQTLIKQKVNGPSNLDLNKQGNTDAKTTYLNNDAPNPAGEVDSSNDRKPRFWTEMEDKILSEAVQVHGEKDWKRIAMMVPERTSTQCIQRWKKVLKPGLKKGHWSPAEDEALKQGVRLQQAASRDAPQNVKMDWSKVATLIPKRSCKQCRERWVNHLDPSINKGDWTPAEDELLWQLNSITPKKWATIARQIPGRTENQVKVRCNILARRNTVVNQTISSSSSHHQQQHQHQNNINMAHLNKPSFMGAKSAIPTHESSVPSGVTLTHHMMEGSPWQQGQNEPDFLDLCLDELNGLNNNVGNGNSIDQNLGRLPDSGTAQNLENVFLDGPRGGDATKGKTGPSFNDPLPNSLSGRDLLRNDAMRTSVSALLGQVPPPKGGGFNNTSGSSPDQTSLSSFLSNMGSNGEMSNPNLPGFGYSSGLSLLNQGSFNTLLQETQASGQALPVPRLPNSIGHNTQETSLHSAPSFNTQNSLHNFLLMEPSALHGEEGNSSHEGKNNSSLPA